MAEHNFSRINTTHLDNSSIVIPIGVHHVGNR